MNAIWVIASNDLRVFLKDKGGYFWLFVMPLAFIYFFGTAMDGPNGDPEPPRTKVVITNQDRGYLGGLFVAELEKAGLQATEVSPGSTESTILIPADFTARIESAEHVDIELYQQPSGPAEATAMVEVRIARAITALTSAVVSTVVNSPSSTLDETSIRETLQRDDAVRLDRRFAGRREAPTGFEQSVPGYVVMFVLMNLLAFGGLAISQERANGILKRIAIHPTNRGQLIAGKILGRFALGAVQVVYLLAVSWILFGIDYGDHLLLVVATLLLFALGCGSLGVLIGAVVRTPESVPPLCTLGAVAMAALGGCWWPLEIVPPFARQVGQFFPTAWAMNAMHQLISFGGGFAEIQSDLLRISLFALVSIAAAARFLRLD